jgi:serine/threonine protein kinase
MEYLEGQSLEDIIQKKKKLNWIQIMRLGREIARGLAVAHAHGLIHRDVKPANIWLEVIDKQAGKTRLKLLDFGLARYVQQEGGVTQAGMVVGTPHYVSPEQARGKELDARSDLFSLGVVLYRLCTRKYPFEGEDTLALLTSLAVDNPLPMRQHQPDIPQRFDDFVMKLLAKNPNDRPGSAHEVADTLQEIYHAESNRRTSGETPPSAQPTPAPPPPPPTPPTTDQASDDHAASSDRTRQTLMMTLIALIAICSVCLIVLLLYKIISH